MEIHSEFSAVVCMHCNWIDAHIHRCFVGLKKMSEISPFAWEDCVEKATVFRAGYNDRGWWKLKYANNFAISGLSKWNCRDVSSENRLRRKNYRNNQCGSMDWEATVWCSYCKFDMERCIDEFDIGLTADCPIFPHRFKQNTFQR